MIGSVGVVTRRAIGDLRMLVCGLELQLGRRMTTEAKIGLWLDESQSSN